MPYLKNEFFQTDLIYFNVKYFMWLIWFLFFLRSIEKIISNYHDKLFLGRTRVRAGPPPDRKVEGSIHVLGSNGTH